MLKNLAIEFGVKTMLPSAIRAVVAVGIGLYLAHQGVLNEMGVVYDSVKDTVTLHLGTLKAWLAVSGIGLFTAIMAAGQKAATTKKEEPKK